MKQSNALLSLLFFIVISLASYLNIGDSNVKLTNLSNKNFNYIVKFDTKTTSDEIEKATTFLEQYNESIKIIRSIDQQTGNIKFEIESATVVCRSSNFAYAVILLDKDNKCQCAIGDAKNGN